MAGVLDVGTLLGRLDLDTGPFEEALASSDGALGAAGDKMGATGKLIGAGIGAAIAYSLAMAINADAANSKLQAQLGLSATESAKLGKTAGDLYASNYGDSLENVNDALAAVLRNVEGMGQASAAELQGVTAKVLDLSAAFGVDLGESTRAVGVLMKNGLAKDATEALDIVTAGLQSPVNAAGDLLDTIDEYSTVFRTMGIEGDDALGLLQQGLQGGARDADQVADSLKELLLRVQAGDAAGGLRAIGLDAQQMAADISAGGDTASAATEAIIAAFNGIVDPADKAQVGVALFGTKAEDAQQALNGLDLRTAASDFEAINGPIAGAADAMDAALGDSRAAQLESFKRGMENAATSAGQVLLPALDGLLFIANGLGEGVGIVVGFFEDLPEPMQIAAGVATVTGLAFTGVGNAIKAAFVSNPVGLAIVGVTTALGFLFSATTSADEAAQAHKDHIDELTGSLDTNTGAVTDNTEAVVKNSLGEDGIKNLRELSINTNIYTDAVLGNTSSQKALQDQIERGLGKAVAAGEGYAGLAGKLGEAGVSAEELGQAFLANDYTSVNNDLATLGLTIYDTGDGLLTLQNNADGSSVVLSDLGGAASGVRDINRGLQGSIDDVNASQEEWIKGQSAATDAAFVAGGGAEYMTGKNRDNMTALDGVASSAATTAVNLEELGTATADATPAVSEMQAAFDEYDGTVTDADNSTKFFNITMNALLGINTTAQEATKLLNDSVRSTAEAFKAAKESTDGNVASLISASGQIDTTTEAGSKLYDGLQDIAGAYDVATTAAYDTAVQNGDTAGALGAAQAAAQGARDKFLENARAMGLNDTQAGLLADSLGIVEGTRLTDKNFSVNAQGIEGAAAKTAALDAQQVRDKSFKVTANFVTSGVASAVNTAANGILSAVGLAEGGPVIGPGPKGVDSEHRILAPGEWVLNDKQVDAMGGFGGMSQFVANLGKGAAGYVPAGQTSTTGSGLSSVTNDGRTYHVTVNHAGSGDVLPDKLLRALKQLERTGRY